MAEKQHVPVSSLKHEEFTTDKDIAMVTEFFHVLNSEWQLKEGECDSGLKVYYQFSEDNPVVRIKGEMEVPASVAAVLDFLHCYGEQFKSNMKVLDKMCTMAAVVETADPKHKINYGQFACPKPVSDRDVLWSNYSSMLPNGDGVCLGISTEHPQHPEDTGFLGYVRGILHTAGYYCENIKGQDDKCILHYVVQMDPQGWLPVWAINLCASDQAHNVRRISEHFAKLQGAEH